MGFTTYYQVAATYVSTTPANILVTAGAANFPTGSTGGDVIITGMPASYI